VTAAPFPILVIHSPRLSERRARLERGLRSMGWDAQWIVRPDAVGPVTYLLRRIHPRLSRSQASVYLKQLEAFRVAARSTQRFVFVIEDDAVFDDSFPERFAAHVAEIPADADIVFFGESEALAVPPNRPGMRFGSADRSRSMSAYLLTPSCAHRLLNDLQRFPSQPIDLAVDSVIRHRRLRTYWSVPPIVGNGSEAGLFPREIRKGAWRSHALVRRLRALIAKAGIGGIAGALVLAPLVAVRAKRLAFDAVDAARLLATETGEQRRLATYGDCRARGYGYVTRTLSSLPDTTVTPVVRYPDFDRFGALVAGPWRRTDPRILVGIDVADADMAEQRIPAVHASPGHSEWIVETTRDIDTLIGFRLRTRGSGVVATRLYSTLRRDRSLGQWSVPVSDRGGATDYRLPEALTAFSISRGATPFVFDVAAGTGVAVDGVWLIVRPVDVTAYSIVARENGCFTAVRSDFEAAIRRDGGPWLDWLSRMDRR
jgi:hypothetical protein